MKELVQAINPLNRLFSFCPLGKERSQLSIIEATIS
jgi:hypothetical protein